MDMVNFDINGYFIFGTYFYDSIDYVYYKVSGGYRYDVILYL